LSALVITHGCRSNLAERDALQALAPDCSTVVNSCAVTAEAVRDARAAVRRAAKAGPVFVTGCAATIAPERFSDLAAVIPNRRKFSWQAWGRTASDIGIFTRRSRGFVAIQDGCDHDCTFCVTRLARGASRSVPMATVLDHVRALVDRGTKEVVLTGIDATSYGQDLPGRPPLARLVQEILARIADLPRLRLSSLDAAEADEALLEAFADHRLMPHVHLSLQSGDDLVLKRMKRRHSRLQALQLIERLRLARPDIAVGADLIAGFPTETAAAHRNSLAMVAEAGLAHAHVFPYSPRPGTAAARMPQLDRATARARAAELRAAASVQHVSFRNRWLGKELQVISEGKSGLSAHGYALRFRVARPKGALLSVVASSIVDGVLAE